MSAPDDVEAILARYGLSELMEAEIHTASTAVASAAETYGLGAQRVYGLAQDLVRRAHEALGSSPDQQKQAVGLYNAAHQTFQQAAHLNFMQLIVSDCVGQA